MTPNPRHSRLAGSLASRVRRLTFVASRLGPTLGQVLLSAAVVCVFATAGCNRSVSADEKPARPSQSAVPASSAVQPSHPAAFRDGGGLTGQAEPLPPPPMKLRWTYVTDDKQHYGVTAAATIAEGTVYVADDRGTLHAIDLATGKGKWKYTSDGGFDTTPAVINGKVYLGDLVGLIHCVSADKGEKIWTFDSQNTVHSSINTDGKHLFFGNDGGQMYSLSLDGKKIWDAMAGDRVNSAPSMGQSGGKTVALFSGCDATLRAIAVDDGKEIFNSDLAALCGGSPAFQGGRIVVGTDQGHVLCFDSAGKQLWDFDKVADSEMVYASPAVSQDGIVVAATRDRNVYGLDLKDGHQLWKFATRGEVDSSPLISDGRVYFGSKDKKFYVIDLKSGKKLWDFTAGRAISASPAIAQGVVVIGDEHGSVYCFEPGSP